jgi:hypothetical protein
VVSAYLSECIVDLALHGGKCHDHQLLLVHVPQRQLELMNCNDPTDEVNTKKNQESLRHKTEKIILKVV